MIFVSWSRRRIVAGWCGAQPARRLRCDDRVRRRADHRSSSIINQAAVPYYLAALAVAIGFQMNLFNIGVEGQYRLAAVVAAVFGGCGRGLPAVVHRGDHPAGRDAGRRGLGRRSRRCCKVTRGVNEVISTIMLNGLALGLAAYLIRDDVFGDAPGCAATGGRATPRSTSIAGRASRSRTISSWCGPAWVARVLGQGVCATRALPGEPLSPRSRTASACATSIRQCTIPRTRRSPATTACSRPA